MTSFRQRSERDGSAPGRRPSAMGTEIEPSTMTLEAVPIGGGPAEPKSPGRLGRFWILDTLGTGGMGVVLEAYDRTLDRTVALKLLHPGGSALQGARLLREAKALARLSHPNVVQIYEIGTVDHKTFIAMELVRGQTLRAWGRQRRGWRETVEVYLQAGEGLAAAHAEGLVHRDFKPDNCIIGDNGRVRVLDFGLAREVELASREDRGTIQDGEDSLDDEVWEPEPRWTDPEPNEPLTAAGAVLGTLAYMSYEQLRGRPADAWSDQFSFCASLYEALHGVRPFSGNTTYALISALKTGRVAPAPPNVKVPRRLRKVLLRGLQTDPAARWPSMDVLLDQLRALVRHRRWWRAPSLLAVGIGLGGGALALWGGQTNACSQPEAALEGTWSADDRAAVEQAFARHGPTEPPLVLRDRVIERLDGYVDEWTAMAESSCRATFVTHQQSELLFDRRMRCLERRRNRLRATIHALVEAEDPSTLVQRSILPFKLPALEPCADLDALVDQPTTIDEAGRDARVADLRRTIDEAHTLREAGAIRGGLALAERARVEATALGDPLLLAEALECLGRLQAESSAPLQAMSTLSEAVVLASRISADELAARAWLSLLFAMTIEQDLSAAKARVLAVRAAVERTGDDALQAWSLNNVGILYAESGQPGQAHDYLRRALELKARTFGDDHVDVGIAWLNLGTLLVDTGELGRAEEAFGHAHQIFDATVSAVHPLAVYVDHGQCRVDAELGRHASAIARCGRVLSHFESAPAPAVAEHRVRLVMAEALWGAGRYSEALRMAHRAQRLSRAVGPDEAEALRQWIAEHEPEPEPDEARIRDIPLGIDHL